MKKEYAFSLIELLVALSILAVVAAIIVPRFLNVRQQAAETAALSQKVALQRACQQWLALGGNILETPNPGDWLTLLSNQPQNENTSRKFGPALRDSIGNFGSTTIFMPELASVTPAALAWSPTQDEINTLRGFSFGACVVGGGHGGSNAHYFDGSGNCWRITISGTGDVTFTPTPFSRSQKTL